MTDSTNNQPASKTPSHIVYHVRDREGGEPIWTRIGAAWPHKDGKGFSLKGFTLGGGLNVHLRALEAKAEKGGVE